MHSQIKSTHFLLAIAALIALIGIGQPAAAKSRVYRLHEGETIQLGNQGLHITNLPRDVSQVYLNTVGSSVLARFSHKFDLKFRLPVMEVRFMNEKNGEVERTSALMYIYFNINKAERALWVESGMEKIAIWYASEQTGRWDLCSTFLIEAGGSNGTSGRLACLARGSGYYALEREVLEKQAPSESPTATPTPTVWPPPYPAWEPEKTPGAPEPGEAARGIGEFIWARAYLP